MFRHIGLLRSSIDDLILKIWFRRRLLGGKRPLSAQTYHKAVHGWQDPPFDLRRLRIYPEQRSQSLGASQGRRPAQSNSAADDRRRDIVGGSLSPDLGMAETLIETALSRRDNPAERPPPGSSA